MLVSHLFHIAIKTADLDMTIGFYTRILGMVLHRRPAFDFQGAWLAPTVPGADAMFHVYAGDAARSSKGTFDTGTGAVDHVSLHAHGYDAMRERLIALGLPFRLNVVPGLPLWQIFVHDPNGVMLELTYHALAEGNLTPHIAANQQYRPGEDFFAPAAYRQFSAAAEAGHA